MTSSDRRHLAVYLNDHLAGSTTATELIRRAVGQYEGTDLGRFFAEIGAEIDEDRETLKRIMDENGIGQDRLKLTAAWLAEKAGRLKFNGALLRRSPLTPFVELETLAIGIQGKQSLWRALQAEPANEATAARLDELIARAERQHEKVERRRVETGRGVLGAVRVP